MFKILQDRVYGLESKQKLYNAAKENIDFVQRLKLHRKIEVHSGCVNTICWNETGQYLLSGSDDQHLVISEPGTGKFTSVRSGHRANIFSAKFLPYASEKVISCSGDGKIYYTDVDTTCRTNLFDCHFGTTYEVIVIPSEPCSFLSCGEDGTVRWFDLRAKTSCVKDDCKEDILINCRRAVTSLAVNPLVPYELSIACADSSVRIYDRRMLGTKASGSHSSKGILGMTSKFTAPTLSNRPHRITSLAYSPNGEDILVSYSSEYIYLFGSKSFRTKKLQTPAEFLQKAKHKGEKSSKKVKSSDTFEEKPVKSLPKLKDTEPRHSSRGSRDPPADLPRGSRDPPADLPRGSRDPPTDLPRGSRDLPADLPRGSRDPPADLPRGSRDPPADLPRGSRDPPADLPRGSRDPPADLPLSNTPPRTSSSPRLSTSEGVTSMLLPQSPTGSSLRQPPIKRLRLRGDWSDTGPHARPESERQTNEQPDRQATIMQRMSDMLTRWLDGNLRRQEEEEREDEAAERRSEVQGWGAETSRGQAEEAWAAGGEPERSGDVVNEPRSAAEDMETENNSSRRKENSTGRNHDSNSENRDSDPEHQDTSVGNCEITNHSHNPQSDCDSQDTVTVTSAIPNTGSLSESQVSVSDFDTSVPTGSIEAGRATSNSEENQGTSGEGNLGGGRRQHGGPLIQEEPVISLQYSSEGTTSSTIRLGFARFENLEAGILERSAENASLQPLVRETTPTSSRDLDGRKPAEGSDEAKRGDSVGFADSTDSSDIFDSDSFSGESGKEESGEKCENTLDKSSTTAKIEQNESQKAGKSSETVKELEMEDEPCSSSQADGPRAGRRKASAAVKAKIRQIGRMRILERLCREGASGSQQERYPVGGETSEEDEEEVSVVRETRHTPAQTTGEHGEEATSEDRPWTSDPPRNEEASSEGEGEGQSRETLERHITAIRLQELYKKRQEERENEEIEMRSIHQPLHKIKFKGHRNARTMIKEANFWGDQFVMSGSDCGHIFIWDRYTARLAMLLEADRHVVNCLQPHPFDPILASSGIDYDIKLWMPLEEKPHFQEEIAAEIMRRNEVMLEETRDTITVPAAFMLRVLASLNQIRAGRASSSNEAVVEHDSSSTDSE